MIINENAKPASLAHKIKTKGIAANLSNLFPRCKYSLKLFNAKTASKLKVLAKKVLVSLAVRRLISPEFCTKLFKAWHLRGI